ncbi:hypothetical protein PUNSTDRAFT_133065 [Punctularia strigosozonata HHB-11173 SS5]|uniref:uncharacterized protein n=1 Tax=Punctularia strigosozonata (strain HHB-11173) TaxID=741275 RepID=UPI0004418484|nr:uncharacterized protein PUNSTDRAFT_133065 [Punctularia strigosozonata HHB-11173 SS5]EIN11006.1 hypothetical protein PUNSTDRAFT_133065 [Punctularia strigosozonata HHB-11173 SS5]
MARDFGQLMTQDMIETAANILPSFPDPRPARKYNLPALYMKIDVQKYAKEAIPLRYDKEKLEALRKKRAGALRKAKEHAQMCERWHQSWVKELSDKSDDVRRKRRDAIRKRLADLGWKQELDALFRWNPDLFTSHPLIKQRKLLTERMWTNMKDQMEKFMEEVKADREDRERLQIVIQRRRLVHQIRDQWASTRAPTEILPSAADVCEMPSFKAVIGRPSDVQVDASSFEDAVEGLDTSHVDWLAMIRQKLAKLVPHTASPGKARKGKKKLATPPPDVSCLDLATTWFRCKSCWTAKLGASRALAHHCLTEHRRLAKRPDEDPGLRALRDDIGSVCWNDLDLLDYHQSMATISAALVELCGMDPATTTLGDVVGVRFKCKKCEHAGRGACYEQSKGAWIVDFQGAINHTRDMHDPNDSILTLWAVLTEMEVSKVRKLEESVLLGIYRGISTRPGDGPAWTPSSGLEIAVWCMHCKQRTSFKALRWHLKK